MTPLEEAWEAEKTAYYTYVAECRGDNTKGRVLPSRVKKAQQEWYAAYARLREVGTADDVREMLQVKGRGAKGVKR
jgi:hypothetical protein